MSTLNQLLRYSRKKQIKVFDKILNKNPQKKGYCLRVFIITPKKPNSALRKVARLVILSSAKKVTVYIRGIGHNLQKHSLVLIQGGKIPDLPGIKHRIICGKYDCKGLIFRRNARSKYGAKKFY